MDRAEPHRGRGPESMEAEIYKPRTVKPSGPLQKPRERLDQILPWSPWISQNRKRWGRGSTRAAEEGGAVGYWVPLRHPRVRGQSRVMTRNDGRRRGRDQPRQGVSARLRSLAWIHRGFHGSMMLFRHSQPRMLPIVAPSIASSIS